MRWDCPSTSLSRAFPLRGNSLSVMNVRGKRIFNYRPVCLFALALASGIIVTEALYSFSHLLRLVFLGAGVAVFVTMLCLRRSRKFSYIAIAFIVGIISASAASDLFDARSPQTYNGTFTARVESEIVVSGGKATFTVGSVYVDGSELYGCGKVTLYTDGEIAFGVGDTVMLKGRIEPVGHDPFDTYFASDVLSGRYFEAGAESVEKLADGKPGFPLNVRTAVSKLFYEHTDYDTASIAQALLLGDKDGIDSSLYGNIQASGLAHALAVSGLHVTALASFVYFLLKKLKVPPIFAFAAMSVVTFLYVAICSFSPSALRAFIMTAALNFASAFGLKKDSLSSLALAASLIMLFSPFSLMHVGFLLSVFAILGIFLFAEPLTSLFMRGVNKIAPSVAYSAHTAVPTSGTAALMSGNVSYDRTGRATRITVYDSATGKASVVKEKWFRRVLIRVSESCAVALAANFATFPLVAYFFGEVQTLFILSNVIILPYVMFIYTLLLIITPFALITALHGLVGIFDWLLVPFKAFVKAVGAVSFASVPVSVSVTFIVCFTVCMLTVSRFVFLKRRTKALCVIAVCAVGLVVGSLASLAA